MNNLLNILRPTLLIDRERAHRNIERMVKKTQSSGVVFRPHFKTHQSARIGEWFRDYGVDQITVSSLTMAQYFADNGWTDITVAFPVNIREKELIDQLARKIRLHLVVESPEAVDFLRQNISAVLGLWIKIDVGYHRTGILWENDEKIRALARSIINHKKFTFEGILTHAGHSYHTQGTENLLQVYRESVSRMQQAKDRLSAAGIIPVSISYGDTPTCSIVEDFKGVNEIRPGNFIFYDIMQYRIGACREEEIAVALCCPVVAIHRERKQAVIHGGAVHLSKEFLEISEKTPMYGYATLWTGKHWGAIRPDFYLSGLSQEHGIVTMPQDLSEQLRIGDLLAILPVHSCLTMDAMREFRVIP